MYLPWQPLLYTAIGAASLLYLIVKYSLSYWKDRGILHDKPNFLWGNCKGVGSKHHLSKVLMRTYARYKCQAPFVGFYAYLRPMVVVLDLDLVRDILSADAQCFAERGVYHNASGDPLSCNMLQLDGASWQRLRHNCSPTFTAARVISMLPTLLEVTTAFECRLDKQVNKSSGVCDILKLVDDFNIEVCASLAYGLNTRDSPHREFREMICHYFRHFRMNRAYLAWCFPVLARMVHYQGHKTLACDYFSCLVKERLLQRACQTPEQQLEHNDCLSYLADSQRSNPTIKYPLSRKEIAAQLFSFVLVGREAANATLAFCLYELSMQPQIQQRARDEILAAVDQDDGKLSVDSLRKMSFLKQILNETLRKHSPYPFLLRRTVKDYELHDSVFMLQKGDRIIIPIDAIHHDPQLYPQPTVFDPERFSAAAVEARPPFSFLPFGAGPRACIARHFAEMQMMVCLATLLRRYRFCTWPETPLAYDHTRLLLHTPKPGLKLHLKRV